MRLNILLIYVFVIFVKFDIINSQKAPKIATISSIAKPQEGGTATFGCLIDKGDKPIHFTWYKNGLPIVPASTIQIKDLRDSSLLIIDPISNTDNGNYSCQITNAYGKDLLSIEVSIEGAPRWIDKPEKLYSVHQNEPIKLKCSASGSPKPRVQWKKLQGSSWVDLDADFISYSEDGIFIDKTKKKFEGQYGCEISNGIEPNLWTTFNIRVLGKELLFPNL